MPATKASGLSKARAQPDTVKDERLDNAYSVMQSAEARLGGGEGVQGIYGSITRTGMQRIFDCMRNNCGFDSQSALVDVGAGLGRPLVHALLNPGVKDAFGIELDEVKVAKAHAFVEQTLSELAKRGHVAASMWRPQVQCSSIEQVESFGVATHAYSFWEGIPVEGREAFGRLFAASKHMKCVAVVQRAIRGQHPAVLMQSYGFGPLLLIANFPVSMSGSGASFQAYVFSKIPAASAAFLQNATAAPLHAAAAKLGPPHPPAGAAEVQAPADDPPQYATAVGRTEAVPGTSAGALPAASQPRTTGSRARQAGKQQSIMEYGRQTKQKLQPVMHTKKKASAAPVVVVGEAVLMADAPGGQASALRRSARQAAARTT